MSEENQYLIIGIIIWSIIGLIVGKIIEHTNTEPDSDVQLNILRLMCGPIVWIIVAYYIIEDWWVYRS